MILDKDPTSLILIVADLKCISQFETNVLNL